MFAPSAPQRLIAAVIASAIAVTAATPVFAAGQVVRTNTVAYKDLDLASESGASMLKARIKSASRHVCGSADMKNLAEWTEVKACRSDAMARAMPAVERVIASARADDGQFASSLQIQGTR